MTAYAGDEIYGDDVTSGLSSGDDYPWCDDDCPACLARYEREARARDDLAEALRDRGPLWCAEHPWDF